MLFKNRLKTVKIYPNIVTVPSKQYILFYSYSLLVYCDFENADLCGWSQDASDDYDWSRGSGSTATQGTGPPSDHTYHTQYGM